MKAYELMLILDAGVGDERAAAAVTKIEDKIKSLGGEISKTDKLGLKRLAYTMRSPKKATQAYFAVIFFTADPSVPNEVQKTIKVTEEILRGGLSLAGKEAKKKDETKEEEIQPVVVGEIKSVDEGAKEAIG